MFAISLPVRSKFPKLSSWRTGKNPLVFQTQNWVNTWVAGDVSLRSDPLVADTDSKYVVHQGESGGGSKIVTNYTNIQMISESLHQQLFPDAPRRAVSIQEEKLRKCKKHLETHHLWGQNVSRTAEVSLTLPPLEGRNLNDHFINIAEEQTRAYKLGLQNLIEGIPPKPNHWIMQEGWTKYSPGSDPVAVSFPDGDAFVFDIEVCQDTGQVPTLAAAVSRDAWYSWCSSILVQGGERNASTTINLDELIPFETLKDEGPNTNRKWQPKMIVGHNVSYDRARIKEQYFLKETKARFLDTMSMHIAVSGITSFQRALKLSIKKNLKQDTNQVVNDVDWNETSSFNNLGDVYKLYCKNEDISKEERNVFITGKIDDIREDFQKLMDYCASDVKATHEILVKLVPLFFERFPHPVTFAGTLEMGMTYLPINENWIKYTKNAENTYDSLQQEIKDILIDKANEALKLLPGEKYKYDPWLWDLDWKVTRPRRKKDSTSVEEPARYPAWYKKLFYRPSEEKYQPGPAKISTSMRVTPKLLRLCWFGCPLHYSKSDGWGFLIKKCESSAVENEEKEVEPDPNSEKIVEFPYEQWELIWEKNRKILERKYGVGREQAARVGHELRDRNEDAVQDLKDFIKHLDNLTALGLRPSGKKERKIQKESSPHKLCNFRPLPHKDGANNRVGSPLAKDFLSKIEGNILTSADEEMVADSVVRATKMVTYWRNNRERIMRQLAVWWKESSEVKQNLDPFQGNTFGAVLPQVIVSGTLTRRAVEPTWMTASNAYTDRVGSELKGMIQAPDGYHFVGADVDSEELWIASVIGDSHFGSIHGCTALGWMTLQGSKSAGTDMHSKTASLIGIDRDQAKVLNYGRIYGAGVTFAERLLLQFNPNMTPADAKTKAKAMYSVTKGERKYLLNEKGREAIQTVNRLAQKGDEPLSRKEMYYLMRQLGSPPQDFMELVDKLVWDGGTESHMFNRLEEIAQKDSPQTPFLQCQISRSLVPAAVNDDFMTSRVNWVVQSSAVDYLHLMLTCMRWLFEKYSISGRFSLSVHDEVRYLVKSQDKHRAAMALQITNLLTRALCCHQLGMKDLPQSIAFFSCVDIDKVIRKEVHQDCKTPSNPDGLWKTYGIPQGEAMTIYDLIKILGNKLEKENGTNNSS